MNKETIVSTVVVVALVAFSFYPAAQASSYLQPGTVQVTGTSFSCQTSQGWYGNGETCVPAKVTGCNTGVNGLNADDLSFTYGYLAPSGTIVGTVVFFSGGPGTSPTESPDDISLVGQYFAANYEIVQVAWQTDWEDPHGTTGGNIQYAACRPAAFLNYVRASPALYSSGGMCAQGTSAGAGAIAYSLAWYGADSFLDKVELLSGPVLSDVKQGCEEPPSLAVQVCQSSDSWCKGGSQGPWSTSPLFISGYATLAREWTNDTTCAGGPNGQTTNTSNQNWLSMSIVNGTSNANFNYQNTAITGWLCASVYGGGQPNNSAPEGELFYRVVTTGQPYSMYPVQNCNGQEGVTGSNTYVPGWAGTNKNGFYAILSDMTQVSTTKCQLLHH